MRECATASDLAHGGDDPPDGPERVLELLLALTEQLSAASSNDDVARIVSEGGVRGLGASAGFVAVESADGEAIEMLSHVRIDEPRPPLCRLEGDVNLPVVEAWRFGVPVLVQDAETLYARYPSMDRSRAGREAIAALPLEVDGVRLGAINLTFAAPQSFDAPQLRALRAFATLCAQALRRVQLTDEVERMRQEFVITASHELRSPLTAVYAAAVALASDMPIEGSSRAELMALIVAQAERMGRVIEDLRLTAELDAGELQCAQERVAIEDVLGSVLQFWERRPEDRGRVRVDVTAGLPLVMADAARLQQVLSHLVDNACRYSPAERHVCVEARRSTRGVLVRVLDDGPGISERDRSRAFDKFYRADPMQRNGVAGTGLGLFVSRRLVDAMGGRIWLDPREGSTGLAACVELTAWAE